MINHNSFMSTSNIEINIETAQKLGLLPEEFDLICQKLGRVPNFTELSMFSGMWSEHCSYKNSIELLKNLFCTSNRLLAKPGSENAGALKISENLAVVFKIESHNHPSAIEPYQGAATGVGGIMRDVFTMGARPIASLNSLRFGDLEHNQNQNRNRYLMKQAVKGIADYGNSLGIPCMGGEIFFHNSYSKNPLVNAMTIGIANINDLASSKAKGIGNVVMYAGAKTGRDGIHGASFASKNLSTESVEERSAIQVGDPFMEKLLMEASLECIQQGLIVAMQDMGAAGLISSSSEMSSSGNVGMKIDLSKIPAREENMEPFEFLLSESQERMLLVVTPENIEAVHKIYDRWQMSAVVIGEIIQEEILQVYYKGELCANLPPKYLAKEAPRYKRETKQPTSIGHYSTPYDKNCNLKQTQEAIESNNIEKLSTIISTIMSHPNMANKRSLYNQYDTDIGLARIIGPGQNAGVVKVLQEEEIGIASSVDGNGYYIQIDPYLGAQHTVAEGFRNVTATGAEAIGITNCLNFANPYIPENFYFFKNAVEGMSDAAKKLGLPITGGNVSFYNESNDGPVLPTPTIGTVGLHNSTSTALGTLIKEKQHIFLLGVFKPELRSSFYRWQMKSLSGPLPELNLDYELNVASFFLNAYKQNLFTAATDISIGGLLSTLLRSLFNSQNTYKQELGFTFSNNLILEQSNPEAFLWGETAHSYLVAVNEDQIQNLQKIERDSCIDLIDLGQVTNQSKLVFSPSCSILLKSIIEAWNHGLAKYF